MTKNRWIALGGVVVVLLAAFAVFRPDKLFVDQEVDEQLDADIAAALDAPATSAEVPTTQADAQEDEQTDASTEPPPPTVPSQPVATARGSFVSQNDYSVTGSAVVVTQPDGRRILVLEDLASDNGPDLQLYASPSADGDVEGGVKLAPLRGNIGTQSYELPADLDLEELSNVVIWCERFSRAFGTASLA